MRRALAAALLLLGALGAAAEPRLGKALVETRAYAIDSDAEPALVAAVGERLDLFHAALARAFAGRLPAPEGRFTVRYCADRAGFLAYGTAHCEGFQRGWHGYFQAPTAGVEGELVAYHLGDNHGVLFHEAFHQAMQRTYPRIHSWPRWFDEGLADFVARGRFDHAVYVLPERVAAGDLALARDALAAQRLVPLAVLLRLDHAGWNGEDSLLHYAEGYLLAHVLMTAQRPPLAGLVGRFLARLADTQDYEAAFAAEVAPHVGEIDRAWLALIRGVR